jgi:hypothetical protein
MYLVISFDFLGSSDVVVHSVTSSMDTAMNMYTMLMDENANQKRFHDKLVEVLEIPSNYCSLEGHTMFWPSNAQSSSVKVVASNNVALSFDDLYPPDDSYQSSAGHQ